MTLDDNISVLIPLPQVLGMGQHGRQEDTPRILLSASTCPVRLLQAFNPGTAGVRFRVSQPLTDCVLVPLGFLQINTWMAWQVWCTDWWCQRSLGAREKRRCPVPSWTCGITACILARPPQVPHVLVRVWKALTSHHFLTPVKPSWSTRTPSIT